MKLMQLLLDNVCNIKDERIKRKARSFRTALLLFLNILTDIIVIVTDWNPKTFYIWLLLFFNFHGCLQLSISIYLRYNELILSFCGFFGIGQIASLYKLWNDIGDNTKYRQYVNTQLFTLCIKHLIMQMDGSVLDTNNNDHNTIHNITTMEHYRICRYFTVIVPFNQITVRSIGHCIHWTNHCITRKIYE